MVQMHLLDDDALLQDWLTYYQHKKIGQEAIKQQLYQRGLNKERVENIVFSEAEEMIKASHWVMTYGQKYQHIPEKALKQKLYQLLTQKGFQSPIISQALKTMVAPDPTAMINGLKKDLTRARIRYQKKYQQRALQTKLINFLLTKGYTYKDIMKVINEETL
jgi:regulatory protein